MRRNAKFTHHEKRYIFLDWGVDGSAHCIDLETAAEVWLPGVARNAKAQRAKERERQRERQSEIRHQLERIASQRDRYEREAYELLRTIPALKALAKARTCNAYKSSARPRQSLLEWAGELEVGREKLQEEIDSNHGYADVWVPYDLSGKLVRARVANKKYCACWELLAADGKPTGEWLPYHPARQSTLARRGYREVCERRQA